MRLTEDKAKTWLRQRSYPVPGGDSASTPDEAAAVATALGGDVVVKALIPTGRRGKAGAIRMADGADAAAKAADDLLGMTVNDLAVAEVYIEQQVKIVEELYLGFAFAGTVPKLVISRHGGVDIEQTFDENPDAIISEDIDPLEGLTPWHAITLWERAGVSGPNLAKLGRLTHRLCDSFKEADGITLEINPLAVDADGNLHLVGTMMEIDDNGLFRHPEWHDQALGGEQAQAVNPREQKVEEANVNFKGGAVRYSELEGDIGLFVAGGGAGLLQHDMVIAAGGRPANHSDISPGPTPDKMIAVFDAIFTNPRTNGILVGFNHLQMAPADQVIEGLVASIKNNSVDPQHFPVVVRVFGPAEEEARALAKTVPGIHYLPRSASLQDGVDMIVKLTNEVTSRAVSS
jgi:succinyl-CoA synthetase beta subunit